MIGHDNGYYIMMVKGLTVTTIILKDTERKYDSVDTSAITPLIIERRERKVGERVGGERWERERNEEREGDGERERWDRDR